MILYEVNLEISNEIFDEYMAWLRPHIQEMLRFQGFIKADIYTNTGINRGQALNQGAFLFSSC